MIKLNNFLSYLECPYNICKLILVFLHIIFDSNEDHVNSVEPSDTIWRQRSGSPLVQVTACCLTAPSRYLNQCWIDTVVIHPRAISQKTKAMLEIIIISNGFLTIFVHLPGACDWNKHVKHAILQRHRGCTLLRNWTPELHYGNQQYWNLRIILMKPIVLLHSILGKTVNHQTEKQILGCWSHTMLTSLLPFVKGITGDH